MDWRQHYQEQLEEEFKLLNEFREEERCATDPRLRRKWRTEIERTEQRIRKLEAKLKLLEPEKLNDTAQSQQPINKPTPLWLHPVIINPPPHSESWFRNEGLSPTLLPTDLETKPKSGIEEQRQKGKPHADYRQLRELLEAGQWKEADLETARVFLKVAERQKYGWLRAQDIENFPGSDLRIIDQLWRRFSQNRFGFSIQRNIWLSVGGQPGEFEGNIFPKFGDCVGWRVDDEWLKYEDFNFTLDAPEGHLPSLRMPNAEQEMNWWDSWKDSFKGFISRRNLFSGVSVDN